MQMGMELKRENNKNVFLIMAASLAGSALIQGGSVGAADINDLALFGGGGLLLSVILVMLANILPQEIKHKLVFLRLKNEMPACRIHELCRKEPRIEFQSLILRWPDIFANDIDEAARNSRWYQQIYKVVAEKNEVRQSHRSFLLYRDSFSGLLIILLVAIVCFFMGDLPVIGQLKPAVIYVQIVFVIVALIAANTAGKRFVVNAVVAT